MHTPGLLLIWCLSLLWEVLGLHRHAFYRDMVTIENGARRIFGGEPVSLSDFPAVCALFDRYWQIRCSGSIISPEWVLTAAHCLPGEIIFIKYNTRYPKSEGNVASVLHLYRHPDYYVAEENVGGEMDVTELRNDVGLIRTKDTLLLHTPLAINPIHAMRTYEPLKLESAEIEVLGFGRTHKHRWSAGDELVAAKLNLASCERSTWTYCVCGVSSSPGGRGVCTGDSGGPMTYNGSQIGITSMGPAACALQNDPGPTITSVFTSLFEYADIITQTIEDKEGFKKLILVKETDRLIPHYAVVIVPLLLVV